MFGWLKLELKIVCLAIDRDNVSLNFSENRMNQGQRMADVRQKTTISTKLRLFLYFLGTTALLAAIIFAGLLITSDAELPTTKEQLWQSEYGRYFVFSAAVTVGCIILAGLTSHGSFAGRRTASGSLSLFKVVCAILALVGINWFSFQYFQQYDTTRDKRFTLSSEVVNELKTLDPNSKTTVVLLQLHKSAGTLSEKADALDYAAERKVVEKVQDLVDQFRNFGPQFNVITLDTEDEEYSRKLKTITAGKPELLTAIEQAPENSILFADSNGKVRRLGFNEFYRLDKVASVEVRTSKDKDGKETEEKFVKNLVLLPQGKEAFARRAAKDEKKPKVGLMSIHPELSSRESRDDYCAMGFRKSLEANGYEVVDVIVKDWSGRGGPKPAGYTYEEYELKRTEEKYNLYSLLSQDREMAMKQLKEMRSKTEKYPLADLNKLFRLPPGQKISSEDDRQKLLAALDNSLDSMKQELASFNEEIAKQGPKYQELSKDERAIEARRITDVKTKLTQILADCDLLVIPRFTVMDISKSELINPSFYNVNKDQADVVKEFVKTGKPVLTLFGPTKITPPNPSDPMAGKPDELELLFKELGVEFGDQTIVYDSETISAAERQGGTLASAAKLPPLVFESSALGKDKPNPVAAAYLVSARGAGSALEFNRSGFRPITVSKNIRASLTYTPEIAFTTKQAWNEEKPIPDDDYVPKFEPAKPDDPKKNTPNEERRGPFSVGVAYETTVPAYWYEKAEKEKQPDLPKPDLSAIAGGAATKPEQAKKTEPVIAPAKTRIAALGHGGLVVGKRLDPATETLMLSTMNWQLRQDDRLAKDVSPNERWEFPRSNLSASASKIWLFIGSIGIPVIAAYFGVIVLLFRRLR